MIDLPKVLACPLKKIIDNFESIISFQKVCFLVVFFLLLYISTNIYIYTYILFSKDNHEKKIVLFLLKVKLCHEKKEEKNAY